MADAKEAIRELRSNRGYVKLQDAIEKKNVPAKHDDSYDAESCSRTKLPTIQMSCFQGEYSEYQPFISLFDSLIHRDKHLDSLQKLYYLRSYLKCEPYDLIKNLPLSNESYLKARQLLDDRYNNKYKILNEHIAQLLDLSPLSKSTSANIRSFVSSTKQIIAAIENLNNDIKYWDPIILCILTRKLDTYTARAYQMERDDNMEPKVKDFIEFLEKGPSSRYGECGAHNFQEQQGGCQCSGTEDFCECLLIL
ncbi:hypothetical protein ABMA28_016876 [Loxostege sticticalis]|uniref:Uncharacterized protein n=1 Tax=Loxostege sticticalis TaxID=481309 RepID=A0ABD0T667_LOXSC